MRYFRAIAVENSLQFDLVANTEAEWIVLGLEDDPLVVSEDRIPMYVNGISQMKIVEGELVERASTELELLGNEKKIAELRSALKELYYEIEFTSELLEDKTALQAAYDAKLIEYNALKTS